MLCLVKPHSLQTPCFKWESKIREMHQVVESIKERMGYEVRVVLSFLFCGMGISKTTKRLPMAGLMVLGISPRYPIKRIPIC